MAEFKRSQGKGFDSFNPTTGAPKAPNLTELVDLFDYGKKKEFKAGRLIGGMEVIGLHKIKVKKKDGSAIQITKPCLAFDRKTGKLDETKKKKCGYCQMPRPHGYLQVKYFSNIIDREAQENLPRKIKEPTKQEKKTGFREKGSPHVNPVYVIGAPSSLAKRMKSIDMRNVTKDKKGKKKHYEIRDPDHGLDIEIKFDKDEQAANMYDAVRSDDGPSALTKEERKYMLWNLESLYPVEDSKQTFKEAASMAERAPDDVKKELKKMGKSSKKNSSDSDSGSDSASTSSSGSGSDSDLSNTSESDKKSKSKRKSKKGSSDGSSSNSDQASSDSSEDNSNSSSNKSSSEQSNSDSDSSSKGSKHKSSSKDKAKGKGSKGKKGKASSDSDKDSDSDLSSDSGSNNSDSDSGSDSDDKKSKSKSKGKKKKSDSDSNLSDLDSSSDDKKSKSKKKRK